MAKDYINNKSMLLAIQSYRQKKAIDSTKEYPEIEYIGECFMKIANKYSQHSWFRGYTFRDEMVSDALIHCMKAFRDGAFDEKNKTNPFAYFTTVCKNAFFQCMQKEEKLKAIKSKQLQNDFDAYATQLGDSGKFYKNTFLKNSQKVSRDHISASIEAYEKRVREIKEKNKKV